MPQSVDGACEPAGRKPRAGGKLAALPSAYGQRCSAARTDTALHSLGSGPRGRSHQTQMLAASRAVGNVSRAYGFGQLPQGVSPYDFRATPQLIIKPAEQAHEDMAVEPHLAPRIPPATLTPLLRDEGAPYMLVGQKGALHNDVIGLDVEPPGIGEDYGREEELAVYFRQKPPKRPNVRPVLQYRIEERAGLRRKVLLPVLPVLMPRYAPGMAFGLDHEYAARRHHYVIDLRGASAGRGQHHVVEYDEVTLSQTRKLAAHFPLTLPPLPRGSASAPPGGYKQGQRHSDDAGEKRGRYLPIAPELQHTNIKRPRTSQCCTRRLLL